MKMLSAFVLLAYNILYLQKRRNKSLFNQLLTSNFVIDGTLRKRIEFYTMQSTITNLWFTALRRAKATAHETDTGLLLGAVTPVYDDLLDDYRLTHTQLIDSPTFKDPKINNLVVLYQWLDREIKERIELKSAYANYLALIIEAQAQSQAQHKQHTFDVGYLLTITRNKGGYATLLYRCLLANPLLSGEEEAIYELGALLQLMNDLFDLYKDTQAASSTLVTHCENPSDLLPMYMRQLTVVIEKFALLAYPKVQKDLCIRLILTMVSQGVICIHQFIALQKMHGHFNAKEFTRKDLICDMDKISNQIKCYTIANQLYKKIAKPLLLN